MSPTLHDLGLDRLSVDERMALAQELLDSIAHDLEQAPPTAAQRQELKRRLADSIARPDAVTPWEEVKAQASRDDERVGHKFWRLPCEHLRRSSSDCPDTGLLVGYVPGFPGAHSQGETLEELQQNMSEMIWMLLEDVEPKLEAAVIRKRL